MMLLKCYTQYISKFGKISSSHKTGKGQFSFKPKEWQCQKNVKTFVQLPSFHILLSKVMLKILQARLQQGVNWELPVVQAGVRKDRGIRDQIASNCWIIEKATEFQKKTSPSASLTTPKPLTLWITANCGKFFKRWWYQSTLPASWDTCMFSRGETMEWFKIGKGIRQGSILSPCLFNFYVMHIMWNARINKSQAGSRLLVEISTISDMQMIPL